MYFEAGAGPQDTVLAPEHHLFPRVLGLPLQRPRGLLVVDVKLSHSAHLNPSLLNCLLSTLSAQLHALAKVLCSRYARGRWTRKLCRQSQLVYDLRRGS